MDCCLCSSTLNYHETRYNTICIGCFNGGRSLIDLAKFLEEYFGDDEDEDKQKFLKQSVRDSHGTGQDLSYAFKQMKQLEALEESQSTQLKTYFSVIDEFRSVVQAFRDGMPADVELITNDGISIQAHRAVMATKSSVFRVMFESDKTKEPHTGPVHFHELVHDELKYLLEFLYFVEIPDDKLAQHSHALFIAADKYDIPILRELCQAYISGTVCASNVLQILELATLCSASSLKEIAMNVILKNYDEVLFSKEYEDFAVKNALLMVEITKALAGELKKL